MPVVAAQFTFEDYFMSELNLGAALIIGVEGLWGTGLTCASMIILQHLPGEDVVGVVENSWDSFVLLASSTTLQCLVALYLFAIFAVNYSAMSVTGNYSAVFR